MITTDDGGGTLSLYSSILIFLKVSAAGFPAFSFGLGEGPLPLRDDSLMSIGEFREERFTGSDLLNVLSLKFDLGRTCPLTGIWIILKRHRLPAWACVLVSSMTLSPRLMEEELHMLLDRWSTARYDKLLFIDDVDVMSELGHEPQLGVLATGVLGGTGAPSIPSSLPPLNGMFLARRHRVG